MKHLVLVLFSITALAASFNSFAGDDKGAERQNIQAASEAALVQLYGENPSAKAEIEKATGYAVFPGNAAGGILHNNHDSKDLYMKMISSGGNAMNEEAYNLVLIFHSGKAMNNFKDVGWDVSGQLNSNADSALTGVGVSGAQSVTPGTTVYQFNQNRMVDQPELQDTKFVMDERLN